MSQSGKDLTIIKQGKTILIAQSTEQKSFMDSISQFFNNKSVDPTKQSVSGQQCTWTDVFASSNKQQFRKNMKCKSQHWKDSDERIANSITNFKQQYLMTIGDIRVRSVLMAFSAALLYKAVSFNTTGLLRKTRNLGVSFAFMGYWFVPQLFNPFLQKPKLIERVA